MSAIACCSGHTGARPGSGDRSCTSSCVPCGRAWPRRVLHTPRRVRRKGAHCPERCAAPSNCTSDLRTQQPTAGKLFMCPSAICMARGGLSNWIAGFSVFNFGECRQSAFYIRGHSLCGACALKCLPCLQLLFSSSSQGLPQNQSLDLDFDEACSQILRLLALLSGSGCCAHAAVCSAVDSCVWVLCLATLLTPSFVSGFLFFCWAPPVSHEGGQAT